MCIRDSSIRDREAELGDVTPFQIYNFSTSVPKHMFGPIREIETPNLKKLFKFLSDEQVRWNLPARINHIQCDTYIARLDIFVPLNKYYSKESESQIQGNYTKSLAS
eukprot:TRINITY_DN10544_c0_g1_i4.p1 TRINITY_DN10544_c0_g1~~TRINITY_DN10544_c0_g1_i4.p1  ORF type:complete len:107 (-),score=17.91 TRINITY_DN10544_c0_g1_i4:451-771(-)